MYRALGTCTRDSKSIALGNFETNEGKGSSESCPFPYCKCLDRKTIYFFVAFFLPKLVSTDPPICANICLAGSA